MYIHIKWRKPGTIYSKICANREKYPKKWTVSE